MAVRRSNAPSASIESQPSISRSRTAAAERKRRRRSISMLPCRIRGRREQHCGTRGIWSLLSRRQNHDLRNDQPLPNLQTATHEERACRYGVLHLRKICLAGLRPGRSHKCRAEPTIKRGEDNEDEDMESDHQHRQESRP